MITALIVFVALGVLSWGFYRARPFGKLGILAWLQSVVLMVPWLVFFALFAMGIYVNLVGVLVLLVISTGLYIFLGRRLRAAAQDGSLAKRASAMADSLEQASPVEAANAEASSGTNPTPPKTQAQSDVLPIPDQDLKAIQGIFGIDTFYSTETIPYQEGAIFKGNLRGEVEPSFARLSESLKERLGDRYRLFLVENQEGKPVVIVLPSTNDPRPTTIYQKIFALVLFLATIATTLETGGLLLNFDLFNNLSRFREAL
ncbi:MAG: site-2 protease family protein, partial [Leptolyngbyaceae bacterium]|nr:site-2 protease family protein [Leptolyngbyaceae bacterium]